MIEIKFSHGRRHVDRKRQRMLDDTSTTETNMAEMVDRFDSPEEAYFRKAVSYVLIDNVVTGLTVRFNVVNKLAEKVDYFGNNPQCVNVS